MTVTFFLFFFFFCEKTLKNTEIKPLNLKKKERTLNHNPAPRAQFCPSTEMGDYSFSLWVVTKSEEKLMYPATNIFKRDSTSHNLKQL